MISRGSERGDIAANIAQVRERIARAANGSGRSEKDIILVAATKQVTPERIREAIEVGVRELGENYVQEAAEKYDEVGTGVRWHMIGHLQRNKAGKAIDIFDLIQTLNSERLAQAISRGGREQKKEVATLIQIGKGGVDEEEAEKLIASTQQMEGIRVEGLMAIGEWTPDPEEAREEFRRVRKMAERLEERTGVRMKWLSMGMSDTYEVAIEEGANIVRIGTGIFGHRTR